MNKKMNKKFTHAARRAINELFKAMNAEHCRCGGGMITARLNAAEGFLAKAKTLGAVIDARLADKLISHDREGLKKITDMVIAAAKEANHDYDAHAAGPVRGANIDKMNDDLLAVIDRVETEISDATNIETALIRELRHVVRYFCRCRNQGHYDGKVRHVHGYKAA